jgi:hypothetical protein
MSVVGLGLLLLAVGLGILWWEAVPESFPHGRVLATVPQKAATTGFNRCTADEIKNGNCCNGIGGKFCDLPVTKATFAMVHNAMASKADGFFLFPSHIRPLEEALTAGYRGINLDIGRCDGRYLLIHGYCPLGSRDPATVLFNINSFLDKNPRAVIMLLLQLNSDADEDVDLQDVYKIAAGVGGFVDKLYAHPGPGTAWPTLRTLISSNKRILFFHFNGPSCADLAASGGPGCPAGFHDWFGYADETDFELSSVAEVQNTETSCKVTRGGGTRDFLGINVFLQLPSQRDSTTMNKKAFLERQLKECSRKNSNRPVNVFMVDFWSIGDAVNVAQSRNQRLAKAP